MTEEETRKLRKMTKDELIKMVIKLDEEIERIEEDNYYNSIEE